MSDRLQTLKAVSSMARSLLITSTLGTVDPEQCEGHVLEMIARLQSLLPANPERDAAAQVEMAQMYAARSDQETFRMIERVCKRGGEVAIRACDMLNPGCGYEAVARWPDGSRDGVRVAADSAQWENGRDHLAQPLEALVRLADKGPCP